MTPKVAIRGGGRLPGTRVTARLTVFVADVPNWIRTQGRLCHLEGQIKWQTDQDRDPI